MNASRSMTFDTIIVGAGAAGCVLAARLSEDPSRSVLLIEAGPDFPDLETMPDDVKLGYASPSGMVARKRDWGYVARAARQTESVLRGKMVGGSSAMNAQIYLWGLPYDFDRWVEMGCDQWSWTDVEPWFCEVESDLDFADGHGQRGPIRVRRYPQAQWLELQTAFYTACRDAGYPDCPDLNKPYATGVGPYPMNNPDGIRVSAAIGYLQPVRTRPNLTIYPDTLTDRVLFDGTRAISVEILRNGEREIVDANEIVVSAGAIGTPLILQRSGVGAADSLTALGIEPIVDLPGVGRNLRDHPAVEMKWSVNEAGPADVHWHQVGLRYTASGSTDPDDMIVYVAHMRDEPTLLFRPTVNLARSAGTVSITSPDPQASPDIDYAMYSDPFDLERMREAIRKSRDLLSHEAFRPHITNPLQPADSDVESDSILDDWILDHATTGHHVCGTCRMGSQGDSESVVDQEGRVFGTEGLSIIDASIFPDCVRANIHATVLMMADRLGTNWS